MQLLQTQQFSSSQKKKLGTKTFLPVDIRPNRRPLCHVCHVMTSCFFGSSRVKLVHMEITMTKPIEEFIARQLAKGYADASEVARQAFLRWMEAEEFDLEPPRLRE